MFDLIAQHAGGIVPAVSGVLPADVTAAIAARSGTAGEETHAGQEAGSRKQEVGSRK